MGPAGCADVTDEQTGSFTPIHVDYYLGRPGVDRQTVPELQIIVSRVNDVEQDSRLHAEWNGGQDDLAAVECQLEQGAQQSKCDYTSMG